jgi:hypothetical protein
MLNAFALCFICLGLMSVITNALPNLRGHINYDVPDTSLPSFSTALSLSLTRIINPLSSVFTSWIRIGVDDVLMKLDSDEVKTNIHDTSRTYTTTKATTTSDIVLGYKTNRLMSWLYDQFRWHGNEVNFDDDATVVPEEPSPSAWFLQYELPDNTSPMQFLRQQQQQQQQRKLDQEGEDIFEPTTSPSATAPDSEASTDQILKREDSDDTNHLSAIEQDESYADSESTFLSDGHVGSAGSSRESDSVADVAAGSVSGDIGTDTISSHSDTQTTPAQTSHLQAAVLAISLALLALGAGLWCQKQPPCQSQSYSRVTDNGSDRGSEAGSVSVSEDLSSNARLDAAEVGGRTSVQSQGTKPAKHASVSISMCPQSSDDEEEGQQGGLQNLMTANLKADVPEEQCRAKYPGRSRLKVFRTYSEIGGDMYYS